MALPLRTAFVFALWAVGAFAGEGEGEGDGGVTVQAALQGEKDALAEATEAADAVQTYSDWVSGRVANHANPDTIANQIKKDAFAQVEHDRVETERDLSSNVTATSSISSKLASEPSGGSPEDQALLQTTLANVEHLRKKLQEFGLHRKPKRQSNKSHHDMLEHVRDLRHTASKSRKDYLRAARKAEHVQKHADNHHERRYEAAYEASEGTFDELERKADDSADNAHDRADDLYETVHERVHEHIKLLEHAQSNSGAGGPTQVLDL